MNIGLYQSASSLSALERWQDVVAQNITSAQTTGFRKRAIQFSTEAAGELQSGPKSKLGREGGLQTLFPKVSTSINYTAGETQPTRRELDVAIQGEGFFQIQKPDGSRVYTRSGEFQIRADRTLVTTGGGEVMGEGGSSLTFLPEGGNVVINQDGTVFQGATQIGKLAVMRFADNSQLMPVAGGFIPGGAGQALPVDRAELLQGYVEQSNVTPLREMVDLVLISRAYEANQKMITTLDQQMEKTLSALG